MLLTQINPSVDSRLSWFKYERRNWIAAIALAFMAGYGLGNGHTTQGAIQNVSQQLGEKDGQLKTLKTKVIPKLQAAAHCEGTRADTAAKVAKTAIVSANSGTVPVPPPSAVPVDNCPHPAGK